MAEGADAGRRGLIAWLEVALQPGGEGPVRDLAALDDSVLLVQLQDGSAWTVRASPGVPSGGEAA